MIPKVIYMCHKDLKTIQQYSQNWKRLNPEYEIKCYNNDMCYQFLFNNFPRVVSHIFSIIPDGPIKADLWRVCIIYKFGGLYVDADIEPLVPLREYIKNNIDFVTCLSENKKFNPHFIMANKGDSVLRACIMEYIGFFKNKKPYSYWGWSIVDIFTKVLDSLRNKNVDTCVLNNKNFQLIQETIDRPITSLYGYYCKYKNKRVLNNRYRSYDPNSHSFINNNNNKIKNKIKNKKRVVMGMNIL
jgi:hypothetical protein